MAKDERIELKLKMPKFKRWHAYYALAIVAFLALGAGLYLIYVNYFQPVTVVQYQGLPVAFRADLREAQKVPVYPDEQALKNIIVKPPRILDPVSNKIVFRTPLKGATFVFVPVNQELNGYYIVEGVEIVNKLTLLYKGTYNVNLNFTTVEVGSYENLNGTSTKPAIALIHPLIANETSVRVDADKKVIYISGKTLREFDLATVKFLMVALGIEV